MGRKIGRSQKFVILKARVLDLAGLCVENEALIYREASTTNGPTDSLVHEHFRVNHGATILGREVIEESDFASLDIHLYVSEMSGGGGE